MFWNAASLSGNFPAESLLGYMAAVLITAIAWRLMSPAGKVLLAFIHALFFFVVLWLYLRQ